MDLTNLRKNMRYLRRKHGFSQEFIGERCNKRNYTTVQKWESGDAEPTLSTVLLLCELYGVSIDRMVYSDIEATEKR